MSGFDSGKVDPSGSCSGALYHLCFGDTRPFIHRRLCNSQHIVRDDKPSTTCYTYARIIVKVPFRATLQEEVNAFAGLGRSICVVQEMNKQHRVHRVKHGHDDNSCLVDWLQVM